MFSQSLLSDIMQFEMFMGPSHVCHDCGSTFLATSDRCSNCASYAITSLHPEESIREKWDMETFPVETWNREGLYFERIDVNDFCPYPRVEA